MTPWILAADDSGGLRGALPGPGPWESRQWIGAALYVALFLLALWGLSRLAASGPDGDGETVDTGREGDR